MPYATHQNSGEWHMENPGMYRVMIDSFDAFDRAFRKNAQAAKTKYKEYCCHIYETTLEMYAATPDEAGDDDDEGGNEGGNDGAGASGSGTGASQS